MATVDAYGTPVGGQTRNPFNYVKVEQLARDNATAWLTLTEITNQLNLFSDSSQDVYLQAIWGCLFLRQLIVFGTVRKVLHRHPYALIYQK